MAAFGRCGWDDRLGAALLQVFAQLCAVVGLVAERVAEWMASDLSKLDLLVIQIDGLHIGNDLVLVAALGIDGEGNKHPLGLIEGATENATVVQALIDNLIERAGSIPRSADCSLSMARRR